MRKSLLLAILACLVLQTGTALAQVQGVELIPFGGYRFSSGLNSIQGVNIDVKDGAAFGVAIDGRMAYNTAVELYYGHWRGDVEVRDNLLGRTVTGELGRDDIMINGVWYAMRPGAMTRPYFTAGLGCAIYSAPGASTTGRFAWDIGAGLRHDFNERMGLRIDGRYMPTWVTTGNSVWCDPFYCYPVSSGEFFDQFELTGGLIIKLGAM
jgi:opacity protein-like surface antigen